MRIGRGAWCVPHRWIFALSLAALLSFGLRPTGLHADNTPAPKGTTKRSPLKFEVSFGPNVSSTPLDGRMLLMLSTEDKEEPRNEISYTLSSKQVFGTDVEGLALEAPAIIDESAVGYPLEKMDAIPAGDYYVQALLNIYETFHRADGHVVKLPMDHGEGQQWNLKPGNLYSKPQRIHVDPATGGVIRIRLTEKIPPIDPPQDTKYVKYLRIQSDLLTRFWGRPMELGAIVVLPEGWDSHPSAHYPLIVNEGHFRASFTGFASHPPGPTVQGPQREVELARYAFYQDWVAGRVPRVILLEIQHPNPYFDDSYAVNSANVGPYGDAIMRELIPAAERKFRGIGRGWARALYGGSTGGWETLGV